MKTCDVIVIGGGSAGVVAALQAGRAQADTLLVEKTGVLGGTLTNAMVNFPGIFQAWGQRPASWWRAGEPTMHAVFAQCCFHVNARPFRLCHSPV